MRSRFRVTVIVIVVLFAGAQFVPVQRTNPQVTMDVAAPPHVDTILRAACYDCHSNETRWPWYASLAPASFLLSTHVVDARGKMNFSEWDRYDLSERERLLRRARERIEAREMPEEPYVAIHAAARLDDEERAILFAWIAEQVGD